MNLNQQQYDAMTYLNGPLLVLAGAGSGKTRVITEKIRYLIQEKAYSAHHVAAITFTNKAAKEMQERVAHMLSKYHTKGLTVSTFHSLGMRIIREEAEALDLKKQFSLFDASDALKILSDLLLSSGKEAIYKAQHRISLWKNALMTPEMAYQNAQNDWEKHLAEIYAAYQITLHAYQALDFDDLIRLPSYLFQTDAQIKYKWQLRFRHLLVDECQDTNTCQYQLMRLLTGSEGRFTAVGDDDQSIYAWRGADLDNLQRLQDDYPKLKIIKLEQNYRSSARILRVANAVIAHNPKLFEKTLWSEHALGEPITVMTFKDDKAEAESIAQKIHLHRLQSNNRYADYAILYRGKHQARVFEEALRSARIPYQLSGGQSIFDKAEIKDVLAYIRLVVNHNDDPAFLRAISTPKRGIGHQTLAKLNDWAKIHDINLFSATSDEALLTTFSKHIQEELRHWHDLITRYENAAKTHNAGELLKKLLQEIDYDAYLNKTEEGRGAEFKWRNVMDFVDWIEKKATSDQKNLFEIANTLQLMTLLDGKKEEDTDSVRLSTLHASKGLEYPHVFLVGCEEGLFPHTDSIEEGNLPEERRLMYVGITRAQKTLTVTHCKKRKRAGQWQFPDPSRFIDEMPQDDIIILGRKENAPIISKEEGCLQLDQFMAKLQEKSKQKSQ